MTGAHTAVNTDRLSGFSSSERVDSKDIATLAQEIDDLSREIASNKAQLKSAAAFFSTAYNGLKASQEESALTAGYTRLI